MAAAATSATVATASAPATWAAQVLVADLAVPMGGHLQEPLVEALELRDAMRRHVDRDLPRLTCGVLLGSDVFG
jgi:hypothetical protein